MEKQSILPEAAGDMTLTITDTGDLLDWIESNIPEDLRESTRTILHQALEAVTDQETRRAQAQRWLSWARQRANVGVVSADVPINVLPGGQRGQLHDVKICCRGPDDVIYDKNKDIRDKVARGNCFLEVTSGPQAGVSCVVYALKKFTGGLGDDDDKDRGDDSTWKRYFTKPLESAVSVVSTRKANGEAAHLAARCMDGRIVISAGSKNVHMLFRDRGDLTRYVGQRYAVAKEVGETVLEFIEGMRPEQRNRLLTFLCLTEYTAVLEILNPTHQHVEDLSHLDRPLLQFICWTTSDLESSAKDTLCTMPPNHAIEIARCLGLPTVDYEIIPAVEVEDRMKQVRQGYGYEGEVMYFLDETQSVIGLLKKKTIWYILCRAIREKARYACRNAEKPGHFSQERSLTQVTRRIDEIQLWLGLDDDTTTAWKELGVGFLNWVLHRLQSGQASFNADLFPATWKKYLAEEKRTDRIQPHWIEPCGSDK